MKKPPKNTIDKPLKDPAAVALGRKGGMARASKLSAERRLEIAKLGTRKRWEKD